MVVGLQISQTDYVDDSDDDNGCIEFEKVIMSSEKNISERGK